MRRSKLLTMKASEANLLAWTVAARKAGETRSEFIRKAIRQRVEREGLLPVTTSPEPPAGACIRHGLAHCRICHRST